MYYKAVDDNMCGRNGFQYRIGEIATADTDDPRNWLYFSDYMSDVVSYGSIILEIEPVSEINTQNVRARMNAKQIRPIRIVPREEIFQKIYDENNVFFCSLSKLKPTFQELLKLKPHMGRVDKYTICDDFNWLTPEEKKALLPKRMADRVDRVAGGWKPPFFYD